jgi:DNA polymerase III alpha subunit
MVQVRNLKRRTTGRLVEAREAGPFRSLEDFCQRVRPSIDEARHLVLCGAMDGLGPSRPAMLWQIDAAFGRLSGGRGEGDASPLFDAAAAPPEAPPPLGEYPTAQRMALEEAVLGLTAADHPLVAFESALAGRKLTPAAELHRHIGRKVSVAGLPIAARRARTKRNEFMKFLSLEDCSGVVEVVLFPKVYQAFGDRLTGYGPFLVRGRVEDRHGAVTLAAEHVERLSGEGSKKVSGTAGLAVGA